MNNNILTRIECSAMRGIAILAILLHNYSHWLRFAVQENEYTYTAHNAVRLWNVLIHPDALLPVQLLSFFGHYGVPVFLFLSGFGLVKKYEQTVQTPSLPGILFVKYHYLKLLRMMIVGFVAFTIFDQFIPGSVHHWHWYEVLAQLTMTNNLLPHPDDVIWPGPYWFFGLMLQLYVVYRYLLYRRHWGFTLALILICWLLQMFCEPESDTLNRLRYNFIGGMLPFGAGLLVARTQWSMSKRWIWAVITVLSVLLVFAMSLNYQLWFWVPLVIVSLSIGFVKILPQRMLQLCNWLGTLSAAMFVAHPLLREVFIPISRRGDVYDGIMLYVLATVVVSWLFQLIIDHIPNPKM